MSVLHIMRSLVVTTASNTAHMLIISSRVRSICCANTIDGNNWPGTEQTCLRQGRAEHQQHLLEGSFLLPLLEAERADTYPVPLIHMPVRATWNWDWVRSTLTTENSPTETTMMSAVKYGELRVTFIADPATVVRHPEVPGEIVWVGATRQPWCQKFNYIRKCFIWVLHWWLKRYHLKETLILASSSAATEIYQDNKLHVTTKKLKRFCKIKCTMQKYKISMHWTSTTKKQRCALFVAWCSMNNARAWQYTGIQTRNYDTFICWPI